MALRSAPATSGPTPGTARRGGGRLQGDLAQQYVELTDLGIEIHPASSQRRTQGNFWRYPLGCLEHPRGGAQRPWRSEPSEGAQ